MWRACPGLNGQHRMLMFYLNEAEGTIKTRNLEPADLRNGMTGVLNHQISRMPVHITGVDNVEAI